MKLASISQVLEATFTTCFSSNIQVYGAARLVVCGVEEVPLLERGVCMRRITRVGREVVNLGNQDQMIANNTKTLQTSWSNVFAGKFGPDCRGASHFGFSLETFVKEAALQRPSRPRNTFVKSISTHIQSQNRIRKKKNAVKARSRSESQR